MSKNLFKSFLQERKSLLDRLFEEISDYDIYCELIGYEIDIGKPIISPIRIDDDVPSFSLFIPTRLTDVREEELWWRDFRDGYGNVIKFVKLFAKTTYGEELNTIKDVVQFLDDIIDLGILKKSNKKYVKRKIDYNKLKKSKEILFASRPYTQRDILWWANYGVDENLLKKYDVRSIKYLLDENYNITKRISIYDLTFAYVIYDKVKVYMPEASPTRKWRNTCPSYYIQGWQQIEGKEILIVTKSLKDILVFKSFIDADVIAPQGESMKFTKDHLSVMSKYKYKYVVYDYDEAGRIGADYLENLGFKKRFVSTNVNPKTSKVDDKDISDYIWNHSFLNGVIKMREMFYELDGRYFREDRIKYFSNLLKNLTI